MCTVVIEPDGAGGFWLAGNRDEARWRAEALPPRLWALAGGVRALAPQDPEGGGTWTGVNEHGLALSLLNHYQADQQAPAPADPLSRGQVVSALLAARDLGALDAQIAALPTARLRPFVLLAAHLSDTGALGVRELVWDGHGLHLSAPRAPLMRTSSGLQIAEARALRGATWARMQADIAAGAATTDAALDAFFASHEPSRGRLSVCKHGAIAGTVSHTRIHVGPDGATLAYAPGPLCTTPLGAPQALARVASASGPG